MFLWHILNTSQSELIHKIYNVQDLKCTTGDWFEVVKATKNMLAIGMSDEEIKKIKEETFRTFVDKKVQNGAFKYLQKLAKKHSKSEFTWNYEKLEQQKYLKDVRFSKAESQLLFELRTRMVNVKSNFKNLYGNNLECQTCEDKSVVEN